MKVFVAGFEEVVTETRTQNTVVNNLFTRSSIRLVAISRLLCLLPTVTWMCDAWYNLTEAVRVQRLADEDTTLEAARRVLRWIQRERMTEINRAALMQSGPRPRLKATEADRVLELLEEHGYLRPHRITGRRKPTYQVNPACLATLANLAGGKGEK